MTTSFPETKTGRRFGLAPAAVTGCLALVLLTGSPARADDPVLAKVNGSEIRQSDVTLAEEELAPSLAQMDPAAKKDNVLSFLIDLKIVAKAAEDKKLENTDDFKKKVYEEASKQITGEQEVHARHILVESEDEAKAVKEELNKGADFAEL